MSDVDAMVGWLREVWDADEQAARQAAWHDPEWAYDRDEFRIITSAGRIVASHRGTKEQLRKPPPPDFPMLLDSDGEHIARHDPADTLARIDGERRVLDQYEQARRYYELRPNVPAGELEGLLTALRALASGYRHRAGWQDGWAP